MLALTILAVVLHLGVVVSATRYLLRRQRRMGDSNVVKAIMAMSVLFLLGQLAHMLRPGGMYASTSTAVAYAITTAMFFLALINCYSHYGAARRTQVPMGNARGTYPTQ